MPAEAVRRRDPRTVGPRCSYPHTAPSVLGLEPEAREELCIRPAADAARRVYTPRSPGAWRCPPSPGAWRRHCSYLLRAAPGSTKQVGEAWRGSGTGQYVWLVGDHVEQVPSGTSRRPRIPASGKGPGGLKRPAAARTSGGITYMSASWARAGPRPGTPPRGRIQYAIHVGKLGTSRRSQRRQR